MNKSDNQKLFELLYPEKCWHEIVEPRYYRCSCGASFYHASGIYNHINQCNSTYTNADEVLIPMREKLGEEKYEKFIKSLMWDITERYEQPVNTQRIICLIIKYFILNVPNLVTKAKEFLEGEK